MRHLCTVFALTLLLAVVTPFTFADGYYYEAGDVVAGETIKADVAAWLNEIKGHSTKAMFEAQFDNDGLSLEQEYLLNTLPLYNTTVDFRISSFVVSNVVSISVELIRTEDDFLIEDPLNGRLVVQSSDTPDGTFSGVLAFSGTSVTLPLESGDTQKYYRAAIIRDASYIFSAAVPLTNSDGSKFVPTGDQIAGYTVTEFDEDMLRSSIRVEFPCQRNTMVIAVPEDMLEAAKIDGASEWQMFVRIVLPLVAPGIAAVAMLSFMYAWNEYTYSVIFTRSPANSTIPLALALLNTEDALTNFGLVAAGGVISVIPITLFVIFAQNYLISGLSSGAVKG